MTSFPSDPGARKALLQELRSLAPELMDDIDTLRKEFPTARLRYVRVGDLEVGEPGRKDGFPIDGIADRVRVKSARVVKPKLRRVK